MKVKDVPQDKDENYEGHSKIRYGRSDDGSFEPVKSSGDIIEKEATACAWDDIKDHVRQTYEMVKRGELSPLAFQMEKELLEPQLLAANVGLYTWRVKRHLKPQVFKKLNQKILKKYADYFEMSVEDLKTIPEEL